MSFSAAQVVPKHCRSSRGYVTFRVMLVFVWRGVISPSPKPKLRHYPLSAVLNFLFNVFAAVLYISRSSSPFATWRPAIPWWQGPSENGYY